MNVGKVSQWEKAKKKTCEVPLPHQRDGQLRLLGDQGWHSCSVGALAAKGDRHYRCFNIASCYLCSNHSSNNASISMAIVTSGPTILITDGLDEW